MSLPYDSNLPIQRLAACFNNTSATYKFYWFLSILGRLEEGETTFKKQVLFTEMLGHAWYTVNYFRISFGKQDRLQQAIERVKIIEGLTVDMGKREIVSRLTSSSKIEIQRELNYFNGEVPHRFLSPWFDAGNKANAYHNSALFTNNCIYALIDDEVILNPNWIGYLRSNVRMLKDYCYWNLAFYLQSKNPNVPDIPNKIIKTPSRKALTTQRALFWDIVIKETGGIDCIYTNKKLQIGDYAVEHFIPYAFVAHDLIWNLIPADRSFNCVKSDKLPMLETHFQPFYNLQKLAVDIISDKLPQSKFLQDYLTLFPSTQPQHFNESKFREQIQPLISIANNNGFEFLNST